MVKLGDPNNWEERVLGGNCLWEWHEKCEIELEEIGTKDQFGLGRLMSLVEATERGSGLSKDEAKERVVLPLPRAPHGFPNPAWIGELRCTGGRATKKSAYPYWEIRLFFAIPINAPRKVVGVAAFAKRTDDRKASKKEEQRIKDAMKRARWLFGQNGYDLADL